MSTINILGPVGFNPTGQYEPTRTYQKIDVVNSKIANDLTNVKPFGNYNYKES